MSVYIWDTSGLPDNGCISRFIFVPKNVTMPVKDSDRWKTILANAPKVLGREFTYYYRRGDKFFFRAGIGQRITLTASPKEAARMRKELVFKNTYTVN